jgi:acyl-CoA thioesterase YciA
MTTHNEAGERRQRGDRTGEPAVHELVQEDFSLVTQHMVMSEHLNPNHHIFGGQLLAWLDTDVYLHCTNRLRYKSMVTVSMNNVYFKAPGYLGDIIQIYARIKDVRRSSVTAEGKAVAYDPEKQTSREIIACEVTYVAVGANGRPVRIFER